MPISTVIRVLLFAGIPAVAMSTSAKADFVIKNSPSPSVQAVGSAATPVAMAPIVDLGVPGYKKTTTAPPEQDTGPVHWKTADGFGTDVPLGFACRQIVPRGVKVTFGPGADAQMIVSWSGGESWKHVLRDAVKPLGLKLVMTYMAVEIRK